MPRRQGYALLIALLAGTVVLAAATVLGTSLFSGPRPAPLPSAEAHAAARDPVVVPVAPGSDLRVSFRTPRPGGPVTHHPNSHQTSYLVDGRGTRSTTTWRYLTAVDVRDEGAPSPTRRGPAVSRSSARP